ncbi:RES family NAD+ phosphorylase [Hydrogenophaga defluvii]|uniref:RES family NAD+ phosphorylase n=1 Tax=Hydrogenophaga defluvii TaxID=249410 RepID=A0ABW2SAU2_9BURK
MTASLWRIATDTRDHEAHDLSGKGAEKTGGRWNRPGRPLVYSANSIALACLETVVHLGAGGLPLNRFLVRISVPDDIWRTRKTRTAVDLPVGWGAIPECKVSLDVGDAWLKQSESALLVVPSAIIPEECNVLINPAHPNARRITAVKVRPWTYDQRLVG